MSAASFSGFSAEAIQFLRDLAAHNERDWFNPRKETFQRELQEPLVQLVLTTTDLLRKARIPLRADPKRSVFRLYRDTRFSPDKSPYKTHISAVFDRTAQRKTDGILYVHVVPEESFAVIGFHQPAAPDLTRIRESIVDRQKIFLKLVAQLETLGFELTSDEMLKRVPRGFEEFADLPTAKYLKYKSFHVTRPLPDQIVRSKTLPNELVEFARVGLPFLKFGWEAMAR
ncbi:MAG TPA: DUF2461 domain-containing protein [Chthoniobacterales bacterium]|nr:DUF2461 domain-containing protein [Chthoniobacterales bacterium]